MTRATIELPSATFSVHAPVEVLEALCRFYPQSRQGPTGSRPALDFDIHAGTADWTLRRAGQVVGSFSDPIQALLALEFEIETHVAAAGSEHIAFHAGGVATANGAWLIAGNPDTGKTSTTFHLLELGQVFLCEEVALYEPATRRLFPHLQTLSVERGFLKDFESSFPIENGEIFALNDHVTRFLPQRVSDTPRVVEAVLLPRFRPGAGAAIQHLTAESVLAEFLGYCFAPQHGEEALFDAVIDLLETAKIYRLTYGYARQARDLLAHLLRSPVLTRQ